MKTYTIEELEEIMKKELETARTEIKREFDKTLDHEKGCRSSEDIYNALLVLGGAEGFMAKILDELKKEEDEKAEDEECKCNRCCYKDICEDAGIGSCYRFLAKF